jgi:hypothetical protein
MQALLQVIDLLLAGINPTALIVTVSECCSPKSRFLSSFSNFPLPRLQRHCHHDLSWRGTHLRPPERRQRSLLGEKQFWAAGDREHFECGGLRGAVRVQPGGGKPGVRCCVVGLNLCDSLSVGLFLHFDRLICGNMFAEVSS